MLSMFPNIRGKMIKAVLNLYVSILKCIGCTPFEINQYVIRTVTTIRYLRVGKTVQIVYCKSIVNHFYLGKVRTHKEKFFRYAGNV